MSESSAESRGAGERRGTVLVVDDEPSVVDLYAGMLTPRHEVRKATGGEAALEKIDEGVDVVLLDRRMPDLTGDEVLERLRADGYESMVAIVTAVTPTQDVLTMDFDAYRVKPIGTEEINELVDELLLRADYSEEIRELIAASEKLGALRSEYDHEHLRSLEEYAELEEQHAQMLAETENHFAEIADRLNNPALVYRDVLE